VGGPGAQLSKRTSTFECLVWETDASQVLNWQLPLNGTCKTPVSTSTVKRRPRDAGLLSRFAKKKPYLRLANKNKRFKMGKRTDTRQRNSGSAGTLVVRALD
jgi:hypothetical protein